MIPQVRSSTGIAILLGCFAVAILLLVLVLN
jgi:hypothetical protein